MLFPFDAQGKLTTRAGQASKTKEVNANYTLDPELDYNLAVDATGGPVQITLPLGVEGQEFFVQDAIGQASTNNITFVPTAPDVIAQPSSTIDQDFGSRRWLFTTVTAPGPITLGVWYFEQDSGTGVPTGDPSTGAYFDGGGSLNSNIDYKFDESINAMSFGLTSAGGALQSNSSGALAHGQADNAGIITAGAVGALAQGIVDTDGAISSTGPGAIASGSASGAGSNIAAQTAGSLSHGIVTNGGLIQATGNGAFTSGNADGIGSVISSQADGCCSRGVTTNGGAISSTSSAASAFGYADGVGSVVQASGFVSLVLGAAGTAGQVLAQGTASLVLGAVSNGGIVTASGKASLACGNVDTTATITASGDASHAYGLSFDAGSAITAANPGSTARGVASGAGVISATNDGAEAMGAVQGASCLITASGRGAKAFGSVTSTFPAFPAVILTNGDGSVGFGFCQDGGQIQSSGAGGLAFGEASSDGTQYAVITSGGSACAFGFSQNGGTIQSNGSGALCFGFVTDTGSVIRSSGSSSLAYGRAATGGVIEASGEASLAVGISTDVADQHLAGGVGSFNFGQSIVNNVMLCFSHGRFADITGSNNTWVDTDPLFVLGIGVSGTNENALQIDKNANIHLRRTVTPAGTTAVQTIDKPNGSVNIAALGSSLVVNNSLVGVNSVIICTILTNDVTAVLKNVVPGAGSFTIHLTVAATAETRIGFLVLN